MSLKTYDLRVALVALATCFGLLALYLAYSFAAGAPEARAYADNLAELPDARDARAGDTAAVDGKIAAEAPLLRDEFVVFERKQTQGKAYKGTKIVTIETGRQPLPIDTPRGRVRVVNDDYRLDDRFTDWTEVERNDTPPGWTQGGITIQGLTHGSPVLAVGVLEGDGDERTLRAETIVAGPKDAYLAQLRRGAGLASELVMPVAGIGVLLLLYALWDGRRLAREER
jgi:hypothetical protein